MCKVKTGEWAQFWCTLLIFTWAYGKYFMPTIIVHQAKEYSEDIRFNIPLDWTVHHTPSDYMDRYGWIKYMTQLSNICNAYPFNNQIIFFDGNEIHFNDHTLSYTEEKYIHLFFLKSGDSGRYQTNDNGPNAKLKCFYNYSKVSWMLKYGTTQFYLTTWTKSW